MDSGYGKKYDAYGAYAVLLYMLDHGWTVGNSGNGFTTVVRPVDA